MSPLTAGTMLRKGLMAEKPHGSTQRTPEAKGHSAFTFLSGPSLQDATTKRKTDDITIDLTDDCDDLGSSDEQFESFITESQTSARHQPATPRATLSRDSIEARQGPAKMAPSLLSQALAPAPKRQTSLELTSRKRKRASSPDLGPQPGTDSQKGSIESNGRGDSDTARRPIERSSSTVANGAVQTGPTHVESSSSQGAETTPSPPAREDGSNNAPTTNGVAKNKEVKQVTEMDDRFAPITVEGVEWRNPAKFCINPPFWNRWKPKTYAKFTEQLKLQFDPVPFAKANGKPVEEVQHVFDALVTKPLLDAGEALKRGEEGMVQQMAVYQDCERKRIWGSKQAGKPRYVGELKHVERGQVGLVLSLSGNYVKLEVGRLSDEDVEYLRKTLEVGDQKMLWG